MSFDYRLLANSYISDLTPYQPGKPLEELERELGIQSAIKLASNENALGPSPKASAALQDAFDSLHFYPDGGCFKLKKALEKHLNIAANQLTVGNGSENILEIIVKSYLGRHDEAIISEYAFLTIPLLISSHGGRIVQVPAKNYGHDLRGMAEAVTDQTRILFIVNPNNPTGTYVSEFELKELLEAIPPQILVVLDEAYYEYIENSDYPDTIKLLQQYPNLIITRTFSKIYGLAAVRLGYAISSSDIADILNRARLPFNVNSIASIAACAALEDEDHILKTLAMNKEGMQQLALGLKQLKIDFIPSLGNFITINMQQDGTAIYRKLLHQGVIVRPLNAYHLPQHLRITIGTISQNERFLASLSTVI